MEFSNYLRCFWPLGDATDATDVPAAQKVVGRLSRSLEKERDYDARGAAAGPIALARSLALQRCTGCERTSGGAESSQTEDDPGRSVSRPLH